MKMMRECRTLPDGKIEFLGHDIFKLRKTLRMEKKDAIDWIKHCAPSHVIYIIDGEEYKGEGG